MILCNFVFVENLEETLNLGKKLSHKLNPQSIVLLQGPIGAVKLHLFKGLLKAYQSLRKLQALHSLYRITITPEKSH